MDLNHWPSLKFTDEHNSHKGRIVLPETTRLKLESSKFCEVYRGIGAADDGKFVN